MTRRTVLLRIPAFIFLLQLFCASSYAQEPPKTKPYLTEAQQLITNGLSGYRAYPMLHELCTKIGHRLSGSESAARAVDWAEKKMQEIGLENIRRQKVMVPHWVRGSVEEGNILFSGKRKRIHLCALGGSIGTPKQGITAGVMEVLSFDELKQRASEAKGKIVFLNRAMDRTKTSWGEAYGGAVGQRSQGAIEAAKVGAVAVLVRSVTMKRDHVPHTGSMSYHDSIPKIPSAAISTLDADELSKLLREEKNIRVQMKFFSETLPDVASANVIGEIVGSEKPDEVILIGGHLDSWDKGHGAHDDGAGCVHVLEAMRLLKEAGLKPKRTIRAIMFMNEENGLRGGKTYAEEKSKTEKHICAIETDAGGFAPRGFGIQADSATVAKAARWSYLLSAIGADNISMGGGGADISPLAQQGVVTIGMKIDGHKYFDYHHSANDVVEAVHERELELGAIALAIFSYALAQEGL